VVVKQNQFRAIPVAEFFYFRDSLVSEIVVYYWDTAAIADALSGTRQDAE
jgi:hypothetical protein